MGHSSFVVASGGPLLYNSGNKLSIPINHKMFLCLYFESSLHFSWGRHVHTKKR